VKQNQLFALTKVMSRAGKESERRVCVGSVPFEVIATYNDNFVAKGHVFALYSPKSSLNFESPPSHYWDRLYF